MPVLSPVDTEGSEALEGAEPQDGAGRQHHQVEERLLTLEHPVHVENEINLLCVKPLAMSRLINTITSIGLNKTRPMAQGEEDPGKRPRFLKALFSPALAQGTPGQGDTVVSIFES